MNNQSNSKLSWNKTELILIFLVFTAPFLGAWLVYNYTDFGKTDNNSYGELIVPPKTIFDVSLLGTEPDSERERLYGKWSLIYISNGRCLKQCWENLAMLQNIRLAMANSADRIQVILLTDKNYFAADIEDNVVDINWKNIYIIAGDVAQKIIHDAGRLKNNEFVLKEGLYLIDPLGNLMMRYNNKREGAGILKDLKRLLRYSRIG